MGLRLFERREVACKATEFRVRHFQFCSSRARSRRERVPEVLAGVEGSLPDEQEPFPQLHPWNFCPARGFLPS